MKKIQPFQLSRTIFLNFATVFMLTSCFGETQNIESLSAVSTLPQNKGNIYYVSPAGSDSSHGTKTQPWKTLDKANNSVTSGDTVIVQAGIYNQMLVIKKSHITFIAAGEVVTRAIEIEGNNNIVRGFTITDPNSKAGIRTYGDNNLIENNEIYHMLEDGMWLWGRNNVIRGNYIHDIMAYDLYPEYDEHVDCFMTWVWNWPVDNLVIENNICNHNRPHGSNQFFILTHNGTIPIKNITIRNNIFITADEGYMPIAFYGDNTITGMQIINNTFYNTTGQGAEAVYLNNMPEVYVANNVSIGYQNMVKAQSGSIVVEENNITSPPYEMQNIQGFDFHLLPVSPLIDAGKELGIEHDFDGNPRDESPDIGAFEYQKP